MPIALPSSKSITLRYSVDSNPLTGHTDELKLLELSPEILRLIDEAGEEDPLSLTIKGRPGDDAVICTPTATYQLRNISISNSLLVFSPSFSPLSSNNSQSNKLTDRTSLDLASTCVDILEMIPTFPKLDRIQRVLKESRWEGMDTVDGDRRGIKRKAGAGENGETTSSKRSKRFTLPQLQSLVQSSDAELLAGLRARNVIVLPSPSRSSSSSDISPAQTLLHLPYEHLSELLTILLSLVVIHRVGHAKHESVIVDVNAILRALGEDEDRPLGESFVRGVMGLFGAVKIGGKTDGNGDEHMGEGEKEKGMEVWECDVVAMVRELGKGLLSQLSKEKPPTQDRFMSDWTAQVGGSFDDLVDIWMLEGEYLLQPPTLGSPSPLIIPFPLSSLPTDPTARFSDLFLTRPRWRPEEMKPFLRGLTIDGDSKGMDKLVAKYVRVVKERVGVWWYPRRLG